MEYKSEQFAKDVEHVSNMLSTPKIKKEIEKIEEDIQRCEKYGDKKTKKERLKKLNKDLAEAKHLLEVSKSMD